VAGVVAVQGPVAHVSGSEGIEDVLPWICSRRGAELRFEVAGGEQPVEIVEDNNGSGIVGGILLGRARSGGDISFTVLGDEAGVVGIVIKRLEREVVGIDVVELIVDRFGNLGADGRIKLFTEEITAALRIICR